LQEQEILRSCAFREPPANIQDSIRFASLTRKLPVPPAPKCLVLDARHTSRHNFTLETRCAQCNAPMTCQPEGDCWCAELPHVIPIPAPDVQSTGCLCRNCLLEKIKAAGASSASGVLPISNSSARRD